MGERQGEFLLGSLGRSCLIKKEKKYGGISLAKLIRCGKVIIDGEVHLSDEICLCGAVHNKIDNTNYHNLYLEKGATIKFYPPAEA